MTDNESLKELEKVFKKMDKIIQKEYGQMCPDFEVSCIRCKVHLAYNKFKRELCRELCE